MAIRLVSPPAAPSRRLITLGAMVALGLVTLPPGRSSAQQPKYYFALREVKSATKASPKAKARAKELFQKELKKFPEVTTDLGDPPPRGEELAKALKARRLKGFGLVLRIAKNTHQILPPAAGKVYRVLMVEVVVAIDAEKLPSGQLALAGEGSTQVGTEISKFKEREREQLMLEALAEATKQAVERTVAKLAEKKRTKHRRRRHKAKRRR